MDRNARSPSAVTHRPPPQRTSNGTGSYAPPRRKRARCANATALTLPVQPSAQPQVSPPASDACVAPALNTFQQGLHATFGPLLQRHDDPDALATPRARCHRRLGISKIRRPKGAPGSRGSCRPDGATSTAHPVRPRVSLLKELCTSPDCCAGCYAGILRRWQVTVRELARNRSIRAYILLRAKGRYGSTARLAVGGPAAVYLHAMLEIPPPDSCIQEQFSAGTSVFVLLPSPLLHGCAHGGRCMTSAPSSRAGR